MSHYTIHQDDDTSKPVHEYRWSLLKDGKPIGEIFTQADAETIRAALNGEQLLWKPIETLPEGVDHIYAAFKDGRHDETGEVLLVDGRWLFFLTDCYVQPTHWMRLPSQPTAEQE